MDDTKTTTAPKDVAAHTPREGGARSGAYSPRPFAGRGGDSRGGSRGGRSYDRPKPEFDQKILNIRRVTRVVAGGRRMSFSVAMVIGDKKGSVGVGTGKAGDTALAIQKALKHAKKHMIKIALTKENSLPYGVDAKFSSCVVMIMPNRGRGLVAGSAVRDILTLAGVKNVTSKIHSGSKNKLNNAKAAMKALSKVAVKKGALPVAVASVPAVEVAPEVLPQ